MVVAADGKKDRTTCIDLETFTGWLISIRANDIRHAAIHGKLMLYKKEVIKEEWSADVDDEDFRWRGRRPIDRRVRRQPGAWQTDAVVAPHGSSPCATRGSIQTRSGSAFCRPS